MVQESIIILSISQSEDEFQFYVMQDGKPIIKTKDLSPDESEEVRKVAHDYGAEFEYGSRPNMSRDYQEQIGRRLFDLWLKSSWDQLKVTPGSRRILVVASEIPEILNLPWELLFLPDNRHIGVAPNFSVRRIPWAKGPLPEFKGELRPLPLRLLYMPCSPSDETLLDLELEEESILKAIGNLDVACKIGQQGSFEELKKRIADFQPHIVHLTGHGAIGKKCPKKDCGKLNAPKEYTCSACSTSLEGIKKHQGYFLFENDLGLGDPRSSEELIQALAGSDVQCVFISGCQTGQAPAVEALGGICQGLVGQEVPLAIGWAASIADDLAIRFAHIFYQNMASNQPIDRALYLARNDIWHDCEAHSDPSWALPVLYSSTTQSRILNPDLPRSKPPREIIYPPDPIPFIEYNANLFVGRRRVQQNILSKLMDGGLRAVILTGLEGSGKSTLAAKLAQKLENEGFILICISSHNKVMSAIKILQACIPKFREAARRADGSGDTEKGKEIWNVAKDLADYGEGNSKTQPGILLQDVVTILAKDKFLLFLDNFEENIDRESLKITDSEISKFYQYLLENLRGYSRAIITSDYLPSDLPLQNLPTTVEEVPLGDFSKADFIMSLRRDPKVNEWYLNRQLEEKLLSDLYSTFGGTPKFLGQIQRLLRTMKLQDLKSELDRIKLLSGEDKGDLLKAQENYFQEVFTQKHYGYLIPESRKALSKTAVYEIPVNLEALAVITGLAQEKVSDFAREWHDRAFAYYYHTREGKKLWAVYRLLRAWLLEKLSSDEKKVAHKAAGDFLRDLYSHHKEGELGLTWVECLQEARAHYLQADDFDHAEEANDLISQFFCERGLYDSVEILNQEMARYQNHPYPSAMNWVGRSYLDRGHYDKAHEWYEKALDNSESNSKVAGWAWHELGRINLNQSRYNEARDMFKKALRIQKQIEDITGEAATLNELGRMDLRQGRYRKARKKLMKSLKINQQKEDRAGEAFAWHYLASIDLKQGKYDKAKDKFRKALEIRQQKGDRAGEAATLQGLAKIDLEQHNYPEAGDRLMRAQGIQKQIGNEAGEAATLQGLARIDLEELRYDKASEKLMKSLKINRQKEDRAGEAFALHYLASIDLKQDKYDKATDKFRKALELRKQIGDRAGEATNWHQLGFVAFKNGRQKEGIQLIALGYSIAKFIKSSDARAFWDDLSCTASELKFSKDQLDTMLREVTKSYQKDGGITLLNTAFKE